MGPLVQGSDGSFYGTTLAGGIGYGTVFKLTAAGGFTVLHSMNGSTDGYNPNAGRVQGSDGNFYGVNAGGGSILNCQGYGCGTIFKINKLDRGSYSVLHNFDYKNGAYPSVTPLQHTNGIFYGDTWAGGINSAACTQSSGCAVFYSWNARLPAFINLLPDSGKVGKTIEFLGQGFKGTIHLDSPYNREGQLPRPASPPAFPLRSRTADEHVPLMKRAMDITGSLIALVLLSPLLLVIALTIKLTSKGPVFFRQKRVGQYGKQFILPTSQFLEPASNESMNKGSGDTVVKFGVVGYGYWGPNVVRNLDQLDGSAVVAVCDKSPTAASEFTRLTRTSKLSRRLLSSCPRLKSMPSLS